MSCSILRYGRIRLPIVLHFTFYFAFEIVADVDGDDVELPAVVQDELAATFNAEREALQSRLHALQAEIEQSQHAFDTYRERAKQSLLKSAAEQKASEVALAAANEQLQVRHVVLMRNESSLFVFTSDI